MVSTVTPLAPARTGRAVALLAAGVAVAGVATTAIALAADAVGADPGFAPLHPAVFLAFVVVGLTAAAGGWAIIRARATRPARVLRVLVPLLTVLSLAPDVVLALSGFIPGTTLTGVVALMLMHPVVAAVAVPVLQRALPLPR